VTDGRGATGRTAQSIAVTVPPPNVPPVAAFGSAATGLAVGVDASASADADGTVASYTWDFGDGGTATGVKARHSYAAAGTYDVSLTVADAAGATGSVTRSVTVAGSAVLVDDAFDRTVSGGLGSADTGGSWTASAGSTRQSVAAGVAELRLDAARQNTGSYLGSVAQVSADVRTSVSLSSMPTGSGTYVFVTGRRTSSGEEYRARVRVLADGRVALALSRVAGAETFPGGETFVPGLTYRAGGTLQVRLQVAGTGTTTVRASVWADGTTEPVAPSMSRTDTTAALQTAGGVGLGAARPADSTDATVVRFGPLSVTAGS
jgi:PKD repeat protein